MIRAYSQQAAPKYKSKFCATSVSTFYHVASYQLKKTTLFHSTFYRHHWCNFSVCFRQKIILCVNNCYSYYYDRSNPTVDAIFWNNWKRWVLSYMGPLFVLHITQYNTIIHKFAFKSIPLDHAGNCLVYLFFLTKLQLRWALRSTIKLVHGGWKKSVGSSRTRTTYSIHEAKRKGKKNQYARIW